MESGGEESLRGGKGYKGDWRLPSGHQFWPCTASHYPTTNVTHSRIIFCSTFLEGTRGTLLTSKCHKGTYQLNVGSHLCLQHWRYN